MNVRDEIRSYMVETIGKPIDDQEDIFELGLVDSLFGLQLVTFVEHTFGIAVEGDDLAIENFATIAALSTFVEARSRAGVRGNGSSAY